MLTGAATVLRCPAVTLYMPLFRDFSDAAAGYRKMIISALADQRPVSMGWDREEKGVSFIVDCYNANPSSMSSGLAYLADVSRPGAGLPLSGICSAGNTLLASQELGRQIVKAGEKLIAVEVSREVGRAAEKEGLPSGRYLQLKMPGQRGYCQKSSL